MEKLLNSLETGFIDLTVLSSEKYQPQLILNNNELKTRVSESIIEELETCNHFIFSVAFITQGGLAVLKQTLVDIGLKGIQGKILTSTYLMFNHPNAFKELLKFEHIEVRITNNPKFHAKGYLFERDEYSSMIVGSSNLTQEALRVNNEWNILLTSTNNGKLFNHTRTVFNHLWDKATLLTKEWIIEYEKEYHKIPNRVIEMPSNLLDQTIKPNKMQIEALDALSNVRLQGENRALIISATGTGKTILSAFDVLNFGAKKFLFIVHREQIIDKSIFSYQKILGDQPIGKITGNHRQANSRYTFATIQTISKQEVLHSFSNNHFDYIVIDEVHRAGASSYLRVIDYFKPKFLLGMTATPERTDDFNIFELFNYQIAYEIRLQQALEEEMLCPFHYYGIRDVITEGKVTTDEIQINDLTHEERIKNIIEKSQFYGYSGARIRCLVFCSRVDEAQSLSLAFNMQGFKTVALAGSDSMEYREKCVARLESDSDDYLEYIFTVDLFNEGIDIPSINQVIMLRPTQSNIIFIQQLGRGLRKFNGKEYLVVIDFIGNYQNNFMIPIALFGDKSYNRDVLNRKLIEIGSEMTGASTINFELVAKEEIFKSISKTKFSANKFLKSGYESLKNRIGRIPLLSDYLDFDSIDPLLFNKKYDHYFQFLSSIDAIEPFNPTENALLKQLSREVMRGIRVEEIIVLNQIISSGQLSLDMIQTKSQLSALKVLTSEFYIQASRQAYANLSLLKIVNGKIMLSDVFAQSMSNHLFYNAVKQILDFASKNHQLQFNDKYLDTNLQLYQRYDRREITKLLNWKEELVALNIGGYFIDKESSSMAIFVNYHKKDDIAESIKYEDQFIDANHFIAISKNKRTIQSPEIIEIYKKSLRKHMFLRKDTDIDGMTFIYLGEVTTYGAPIESEMINNQGNKVSVIKIHYLFYSTVRKDIYNYLTMKSI